MKCFKHIETSFDHIKITKYVKARSCQEEVQEYKNSLDCFFVYINQPLSRGSTIARFIQSGYALIFEKSLGSLQLKGFLMIKAK